MTCACPFFLRGFCVRLICFSAGSNRQPIKIDRVVVQNCFLRFIAHIVAREKFRHHSYFSDIAVGCIVGLGALGYELAVQAAATRVTTR